jgi:hypothetical protein
MASHALLELLKAHRGQVITDEFIAKIAKDFAAEPVFIECSGGDEEVALVEFDRLLAIEEPIEAKIRPVMDFMHLQCSTYGPNAGGELLVYLIAHTGYEDVWRNIYENINEPADVRLCMRTDGDSLTYSVFDVWSMISHVPLEHVYELEDAILERKSRSMDYVNQLPPAHLRAVCRMFMRQDPVWTRGIKGFQSLLPSIDCDDMMALVILTCDEYFEYVTVPCLELLKALPYDLQAVVIRRAFGFASDTIVLDDGVFKRWLN